MSLKNRTKGNASEVLEGNKLGATPAQAKMDHLDWANKMDALLTYDKITKPSGHSFLDYRSPAPKAILPRGAMELKPRT